MHWERLTRDQFCANAGWLALKTSVDIGSEGGDGPFSMSYEIFGAGWSFSVDMLMNKRNVSPHQLEMMCELHKKIQTLQETTGKIKLNAARLRPHRHKLLAGSVLVWSSLFPRPSPYRLLRFSLHVQG